MKIRGAGEDFDLANQPPKDGEVKPGIYHHWKGGEYEVHGVALNRDTGNLMVVYTPRYGDKRMEYKPLDEFTENIQRGDYNGPRYFYVRET